MSKIIEVIVIVEGQTEEAFIKQVVAPTLQNLCIYLKPTMMTTSIKNGRHHKGGGLSLKELKLYAKQFKNQSNQPIVTTFFDLYALPSDFANYQLAQQSNNLNEKVKLLNEGLNTVFINDLNFPQERFIPHIQPYEFEALLFSDTQALASIEPKWKIKEEKNQALKQIRKDFESPEHINNSPETAPSKRLLNVLENPSYIKRTHGPLAAQKTTLEIIEKECLHFRAWMNQLRELHNKKQLT